MICEHKPTFDHIARHFRQTLQPEICYEACRHRILLIKDMSGVHTEIYAYHMHGKVNGTEKIYERFTVELEDVIDLQFISHTNYTPQDIETLCESSLGLRGFSQALTTCYPWSLEIISVLQNVNTSIPYGNALYTGYLSSYSEMNATTQFIVGSCY